MMSRGVDRFIGNKRLVSAIVLGCDVGGISETFAEEA